MSLLLRRTISTPKCLSPFQQGSPFSTLRTPQPRKPRTPKIPPSLTSSKMVNKPRSSSSTWPRPTQIPFQPKVANSVNLFGKIEVPIQFHATPDGKHMASTFISQKNVNFNGKCSDSLSFPVVFEGDLAHTVACHVKKDDCVYVTGKLSLAPLPFVLSEYQGKFYVIGDELNFVEGFERKEVKHVEMDLGNDIAVKKQVGNRKCSVDGKRVGLDRKLEELNLENKIEEMEIGVLNTEEKSNKIEEKEVELLKTEKKRSSGVRGTKKDGEPGLTLWKESEVLNTEKKSNEIEEKGIELLNTGKKRSSNVGGATKDVVLDSWKDFLKNPMDWLDNREKKSSGLVKANFPDFKHKTNGTPLWLSSAPKGVLLELGRLGPDVDSQVHIPKGWPTKDVMVKNEDSWKSLVENPDKWWDCRSKKTSIKSPDFKHKDTGEALWLNNSPKWVLSRLLPSEKEQNVSVGNNKALGLDGYAQVQVPKGLPANGVKVKDEDSWKSLVENPNKWWDCRSKKTSIKSPDFKHKDTGEALWLNNSPEWVLSQLPPLQNEQNASSGNKKAIEGLDVDAQVQVPKLRPTKYGKVKNEDSWKSLVENPDKWWDNRSGKTNIKAPDFKHKETGEALWLNNSPEWVLSQLPPSKNVPSFATGYKKAFVE